MDLDITGLLYDQECPLDYKGLAVDCMECLEIYMGSKEKADG